MSEWSEAEQRVARAREHFDRRQWTAALAELRAAIAIHPDNPSWHVNLGLILDELGRFDEAIAAYNAALDLTGDDVNTLVFVGVDLHRLGRHGDAIETFEKCQRIDPSFEPSYCHRILVHSDLGEHDRAEEMFYLARLYKEQCPRCFHNMGDSLAARGQYDRAIACWQRAIDLDPELIGANQKIAQVCWIKGDLERARRHFLLGLRSQPTYIPTLLNLGLLLLDMDNIEDAGAKFRHAVELAPDNAATQYHFGRFQARHGQPNAAMHALERCLQLDPTYPAAHLRLGELHRRLGHDLPALHHTRAELSVRPDDLSILIDAGALLLELGRTAEAADCFQRAINMDPASTDGWHFLALAWFAAGEFDQGIAACRSAVKLAPNHAASLHNLALAYHRTGHRRRARAMARRALCQNPADPATRNLSRWLSVRHLLHRFRRIVRL